MHIEFRYVDETSDASVTLHLFKTINGTPRGDVRGPATRTCDGRPGSRELQLCLVVRDAFPIAIRMANRNNVDLVISGDRTLWNEEWGSLGRSGTQTARRTLATGLLFGDS